MSTRDEYVEVIKNAFTTLAKQAAMRYLLSNLPFLAISWINPIASYFVGIVIEGIVVRGETAAFFLYIDMRVGQQAKDFEAAAYENYHAQQNGTPQEKKDAEANLKNKFRAFAVLTN